MHNEDIYRTLQQHLDKQAVGFPSVRSGADIRLLKHLFTPDEARLALHLTYKPASTGEVAGRAAEFTPDQVRTLLAGMFSKGAIAWKEKNGGDHWYAVPLVIGFYELQDGAPSREFMDDAEAYMKTLGFAKSFLNVKPSQMRTIPIAKSIPVEHHVATYDQVRAMVDASPGPYVVLPCICRKGKEMKGAACKKTSRSETCLAFGSIAAGVRRRGHGREVTRDEVVEILRKNEEDGLVLQPANTQSPEFICSCCGCCCGMLAIQKFMPRPVDFWTSNFHAGVAPELCIRCGLCTDRCQVNAVALTGPSGEAAVDLKRCIGCGLCVPTCPSGAIRLTARAKTAAPPRDEEELLDTIKANRKGPVGELGTVVKVAVDKITE